MKHICHSWRYADKEEIDFLFPSQEKAADGFVLRRTYELLVSTILHQRSEEVSVVSEWRRNQQLRNNLHVSVLKWCV